MCVESGHCVVRVQVFVLCSSWLGPVFFRFLFFLFFCFCFFFFLRCFCFRLSGVVFFVRSLARAPPPCFRFFCVCVCVCVCFLCGMCEDDEGQASPLEKVAASSRRSFGAFNPIPRVARGKTRRNNGVFKQVHLFVLLTFVERLARSLFTNFSHSSALETLVRWRPTRKFARWY